MSRVTFPKGKHLLAEFFYCDPKYLDDKNKIMRTMRKGLKAAKLTVARRIAHHFLPHGVTFSIILQESHASLSTWPESQYLTIDVQTCGTKDDPVKLIEVFKELFHPTKIKVKYDQNLGEEPVEEVKGV